MKQLNVKKLVLLNLPYLLLGLFATNLGEAWRLAVGADASAKLLSFSPPCRWPWKLVAQPAPAGPGCWPVLRRWPAAGGLSERQKCEKIQAQCGVRFSPMGHPRRYCPLHRPGVQNTFILTQTERLTMSSRPKNPKYARNKNVLVIGGSGSGKTRFWLKPNLMQMHSSYVVTDPRAPSWLECGKCFSGARQSWARTASR